MQDDSKLNTYSLIGSLNVSEKPKRQGHNAQHYYLGRACPRSGKVHACQKRKIVGNNKHIAIWKISTPTYSGNHTQHLFCLHTNRIHQTISPRTILTGTTISYDKHCKIPFGTSVQVHEQHYNLILPCTRGHSHQAEMCRAVTTSLIYTQ